MLFGLLERSLSRGQARNRHTWRRAANVVKANIVEELNGGWVAAVFSADAELKVFLRAAPFLNADFDKLANTGRIDRCEWILRQNVEILVFAQEEPASSRLMPRPV